MIEVLNRKATAQQRKKREAGWAIVDVTSKSEDPNFVKFSPFYPVGGLSIPGQPTLGLSESVEGIWQGLKVFEKEGIDKKKFSIKTMKNLKRASGEKRGKVVGHMYQGNILGYLESRKKIYLPAYAAALDRLKPELDLIRKIAEAHGNKLVLLDYETNTSVDDTSKPLSHASLVAKALLGTN